MSRWSGNLKGTKKKQNSGKTLFATTKKGKDLLQKN
jgi:predicted transcriptional regulator